MQIGKQDLEDLINLVVKTTIDTLEKRNLIGESSANPKMEKHEKQEKSAYQKTEQLLYNYNGFKRVIREREQEIEELRRFGVPKKCGGVTEYVDKGGMPQGIVLEEESVESAVANVQRSVQGTVQVVSLIDKCMAALKRDPYYKVLEMRYFEGRTQEDIALEYNTTQKTISVNKARLVRELALRLFPDEVVSEMMN